jgi:hypothetical protein
MNEPSEPQPLVSLRIRIAYVSNAAIQDEIDSFLATASRLHPALLQADYEYWQPPSSPDDQSYDTELRG